MNFHGKAWTVLRGSQCAAMLGLLAALGVEGPRSAVAQTTASGSMDLTSVALTPGSGLILWTSPWSLTASTSAFSTDGGFSSQTQADPASVSASSSVLYASANGSAAAVPGLSGLAAHIDGTVNLPGGFDQLGSVGLGGNNVTLETSFSLSGASGSVPVSFGALIAYTLSASADASGTVEYSDVIFNLNVDGASVLYFSDSLSASASGSKSVSQPESMSNVVMLDASTPHDLLITLDTEQQASTVAVPESGGLSLMLYGLLAGGAARAFHCGKGRTAS